MNSIVPVEPVDYLLVGAVTQDVTPAGLQLGGTASYASLTAHAFGLRVGVVTSCRKSMTLDELSGIQVIRKESPQNTTFENINTPAGRVQYIRTRAERLTIDDVPLPWRKAPIVHLGPVAAEVDPSLADSLHGSMLGLTPQGWLRQWDTNGLVSFFDWPGMTTLLKKANIAILSIEDVRGSEDIIQEYSGNVPILILTEGARGERVYWNNDVRYIRPPKEVEIDSVGAGDIFAASFFIRYQQTHDPWEAARVATQLAARSVTRMKLASIPTPEEVRKSLLEIID